MLLVKSRRPRLVQSLGAALPARLAESSGTTYYVGGSGASDANAGTNPAAPWATLDHAFQTAPDNAIVKVRPGTYTETINVTRGGSDGSNVITVEAESTRPTLQGNLQFQGVNAKYWRVRNLIFDANGNTTGSKCTYSGADPDAAGVGAHHIEYYGCDAFGTVGQGAGFQVTGTSVHDLQWWNCLAYNNDITLTTAHGWYLDAGSELYLMNCIARDNGGYGLHVYNGSGGQQPERIYFYNCIGVSQQLRGGVLVRGDSAVLADIPQDVHFYNCIAAHNNEGSGTQSGWRFHAAGVSDFTGYILNTLENCLAYDNLNGDIAGTNAASMYTATGFISGQDPLFVSSSDYHLQAGSPCINAGLPNYTPPIDFDGNTRVNPDIGAYKF